MIRKCKQLDQSLQVTSIISVLMINHERLRVRIKLRSHPDLVSLVVSVIACNSRVNQQDRFVASVGMVDSTTAVDRSTLPKHSITAVNYV